MAGSCRILLLLTALVLPATASAWDGDCGIGDGSRGVGLKLKLVAVAAVLAGGALGVSATVVGRWVPALRPREAVFAMLKAFAAGVILATALVHILPNAFVTLTSPCLPERPWREFPFAGLVAAVSAMATLAVETLASGYYERSRLSNAGEDKSIRVMHEPEHSRSDPDLDPEAGERIRHRVVSQVLELGIVVHSVIIGVSLGASDSQSTIRALVGALGFHQFFEGMGLGGCILQARMRAREVVVMALFFSLTMPVGIVVGIAVASVYQQGSPRALAVEGVLDAASAGILLYMALVDLIAAEFMSAQVRSSGKLQFLSCSALFLGAGLMSILAVWA